MEIVYNKTITDSLRFDASAYRLLEFLLQQHTTEADDAVKQYLHDEHTFVDDADVDACFQRLVELTRGAPPAATSENDRIAAALKQATLVLAWKTPDRDEWLVFDAAERDAAEDKLRQLRQLPSTYTWALCAMLKSSDHTGVEA